MKALSTVPVPAADPKHASTSPCVGAPLRGARSAPVRLI